MTLLRPFLLALLAATLGSQAAAQPAQPGQAMQPPPLPLRNLLIEVRQDDENSSTRERIAADAAVRAQPGRTEADVRIAAQTRERDQRGSAQQQALVLNGRPTSIRLGNAVPLRLRQIVTQGGVRRAVPGTVWLEAGTGFTATPIWEGADTVYLELTATQGRNPLGTTASTSTTLMLPLGEWMTIADSEDVQDNTQNTVGLAGGGRDIRSSSTKLRVQVRVSVR